MVMEYVVFDLEWNQCPWGKSRENPKIPFEIIEIGAVRLDSGLRETGHFHEYVRPLVYRTLNHRTMEIVAVTQKDIRNARTFCPVIKDFLSWCGKDVKFVTWGSTDLYELQRNMAYYRLENPFPFPLMYVDLQKVFSMARLDGKKRMALKEAVEDLGIPECEEFHSARGDAHYTSQVMRAIDFDTFKKYESVDYFRLPKDRNDEIFLDFGTYTKYVSRVFSGRVEAMADRRTRLMRCGKCGLPVRKRIKWFAAGGNIFLSLVQCPVHGYYKGKIRIKKSGDGVFVVKTCKPATREAIDKMKRRRETIRKKRRERRRRDMLRWEAQYDAEIDAGMDIDIVTGSEEKKGQEKLWEMAVRAK